MANKEAKNWKDSREAISLAEIAAPDKAGLAMTYYKVPDKPADSMNSNCVTKMPPFRVK